MKNSKNENQDIKSEMIKKIEEEKKKNLEEIERVFLEKIEKENERIEKVEILSNLLEDKNIKKLFPSLEDIESLVMEMIEILNLKEVIKSKLNVKNGKSKKEKFVPDSSHVFHFKIYKFSHGSLGDRKIMSDILPSFGFPNVEEYSSPYQESVKMREGFYDLSLNESHKSILEDHDLLGDILEKSRSNSKDIFNELKEC